MTRAGGGAIVPAGPIEKQVLKLHAARVSYRKIADQLPVSPSTAHRIVKKAETQPNPVLGGWAYRARVLARPQRLLTAATMLLLAAAAIVVIFAWGRVMSDRAPAGPSRVVICVHRTGHALDGFTSGAGGCPATWNAVTLTSGTVPAG